MDHIGLANGFAHKLERTHRAERDQRDQQAECQVHPSGLYKREQCERKRDGQENTAASSA